jgi:hypothetical protein
LDVARECAVTTLRYTVPPLSDRDSNQKWKVAPQDESDGSKTINSTTVPCESGTQRKTRKIPVPYVPATTSYT